MGVFPYSVLRKRGSRGIFCMERCLSLGACLRMKVGEVKEMSASVSLFAAYINPTLIP